MSHYEAIKDELRQSPRTWLVTGVAGFIGSNLLSTLLSLDQVVVGLDDYSTGYKRNLDEVLNRRHGGGAFRFVEGDIRDEDACLRAVQGVDYVLHQAALVSVPRSIADPGPFNRTNVDGFVNLCVAARDAQVRRFVYASSSALYGNAERLPQEELGIGASISPYALTKRIDELYAELFASIYGFDAIGLRYFNVFGARQDPSSAYASVIPLWIRSLIRGETCRIHGDGETTRDFCHVDDVVQANLLAAVAPSVDAPDRILNVGSGRSTSLTQLFEVLEATIARERPDLAGSTVVYGDFREGDVRHTLADISRIRRALGFEPTQTLESGLRSTVQWYLSFFARAAQAQATSVPFPRKLRVSLR